MKGFCLQFCLLLTLGCSSRTGNETSSENKPSASIAPPSVNAENKPGKNAVASLYTLEPATKEAFDRAATNTGVSFTMDKDDARKVNGVITLKIGGKWKPVSMFRDTLLNTDDSAKKEFRYLGQYQKLNKYLVAGIFYENYQTYLIDKTTGEITTTWTEPAVSPDYQFLANISFATAMDPVPTGIQVWKVVARGGSSSVEKYFQLEQPDWKPFELYWESARTIIIKIIPLDKFESLQAEPKQEDFSYLRLKLKKA